MILLRITDTKQTILSFIVRLLLIKDKRGVFPLIFYWSCIIKDSADMNTSATIKFIQQRNLTLQLFKDKILQINV